MELFLYLLWSCSAWSLASLRSPCSKGIWGTGRPASNCQPPQSRAGDKPKFPIDWYRTRLLGRKFSAGKSSARKIHRDHTYFDRTAFHDEMSGGVSDISAGVLSPAVHQQNTCSRSDSHPTLAHHRGHHEVPGDKPFHQRQNTIIFPFAISTSKPNLTPGRSQMIYFTWRIYEHAIAWQPRRKRSALIPGGTTALGRDTATLFFSKKKK